MSVDPDELPFAIPPAERDDLHLRLHLAKAELDGRWSELERAWREAELRLGSGDESDRAWRRVADATARAMADLQSAIEALRHWP
jgi:hypothetical protein